MIRLILAFVPALVPGLVAAAEDPICRSLVTVTLVAAKAAYSAKVADERAAWENAMKERAPLGRATKGIQSQLDRITLALNRELERSGYTRKVWDFEKRYQAAEKKNGPQAHQLLVTEGLALYKSFMAIYSAWLASPSSRFDDAFGAFDGKVLLVKARPPGVPETTIELPSFQLPSVATGGKFDERETGAHPPWSLEIHGKFTMSDRVYTFDGRTNIERGGKVRLGTFTRDGIHVEPAKDGETFQSYEQEQWFVLDYLEKQGVLADVKRCLDARQATAFKPYERDLKVFHPELYRKSPPDAGAPAKSTTSGD
jgi:hypothetical protein